MGCVLKLALVIPCGGQMYVVCFFFFERRTELHVFILVKAQRPITVSRNTNILHTKSGNLTWVLPTTTQILQELAFEPLSHNNAPLLKRDGRSE
jgi:hypothetical protein